MPLFLNIKVKISNLLRIWNALVYLKRTLLFENNQVRLQT